LLTLSEVGERTGISMPSLLRYKKEHQGRIPAVGKGRTQRYPVAALEVFEAIKRENLSKRGRPKGGGVGAARRGRPAGSARKAAGGGRRGGRRVAAAGGGGEAAGGELLTLTEVANQAGISYPTARNYAEQHSDRLPSAGEGRKRRYRPEAVAVFQEIRAASRPGRKPAGGAAAGAAKPRAAKAAGGAPARAARGSSDGVGSPELVRRVEELAKRQERLEGELARLKESLTRPVEATLRLR
jgi:DNA-binding transcriptional MerR regulator